MAREAALYDENTLRRLGAIDRHNLTAGLDGFSPRDLVFGGSSSSVQIEEIQDSSSEQEDTSQDGDSSPSGDPPSPKRFRSGEQVGSADSESHGGGLDSLDNPLVSRQERAALLTKFKREQRVCRRRYRASVRGMWDADIADDKENRPSQDEERGVEALTTRPVDPEESEEAFENYLFDRMMVFDGDAAFQLVRFRSSLRVVPERLGGPDPALIHIRTANLWEGLRRMYFGEQEAEYVVPVPEPSHEQIMNNLRQEIAELEERKERAERRSRAFDSGRPSNSLRREDEEDDPFPDGQSGHSVAIPTVLPPATTTRTPQTALASKASGTIRKLVLLSKRVLRRVMAARESLVKFGTFVPRNDREADHSPEAPRWKAGRDLEWFRLLKEGTFDGDWTWEAVQGAYPNYRKSDVGFLFYVYDFKFSGEHRVRLVFDGSRQSASTYKETYAPTVRAESVRLFHIYCVEEGLHIGQYDVPQAFLKADIDHDIFVYPPKGQGDFPGQILKLRKALYGGKQSAFLWFTLVNSFILSLGFSPSPLDSCFYRRSDAVLILYCDDLRIGAAPDVLASLHAALSEKFSVTTAAGDRFLGMDTHYDPERGILKLSMKTYIETTMERFKSFDLSQGFPYRELVGCLLWITLNVMGPELLRVKDLARLSNSYGEQEYGAALKVLKRVFVRRCHGIVIFRHAAGKEVIPTSQRPPFLFQMISLGSVKCRMSLGQRFRNLTMKSRKIPYVKGRLFLQALELVTWWRMTSFWTSRVCFYQ
jgi:hypothetical protein